jgi:ribonucleoside-triphosphate reductase (formate)
MTGSCNVITLNLNRIIQNWYRGWHTKEDSKVGGSLGIDWSEDGEDLKNYIASILERVYKYHIAYKTMLYDLEEKGMFAASNGGYIKIKKLYSTIGIIGYFEAAKFLGLNTSNNSDYKKFLQLILSTIKEQNKVHSTPSFLFNTEAIPGEGLGVKLYNWDKKDNYVVPEDQNLYNCYFYNPWTTESSILDKMKLHGKEINNFTDGGQACHLNLDTHLTKEQYLKLLDVAITEGVNYFTFNIPITECKDCHHIVNMPITECPVCHSKNMTYYTRIIGYLTAVDNWSNDRQKEFTNRKFYH